MSTKKASAKKANKKWVIFNTDAMFEDEAFEDWKAVVAEMNPDWNPTRTDWYQEVWDELDDERMNLDVKVDGVIVAFANLGRWWGGRVNGSKIYGTKVADILNPMESEYPEFYADRYNVRAILPDHDSTHYVLFRVAKDMDQAEKLVDAIAYKGMAEKQFRKRTKSLRPYVAEVYGWKKIIKK